MDLAIIGEMGDVLDGFAPIMGFLPGMNPVNPNGFIQLPREKWKGGWGSVVDW